MAYVGLSQLRGEEPEPHRNGRHGVRRAPTPATAPAIPQRWLQPIGDRKPEVSSLALGIRQGDESNSNVRVSSSSPSQESARETSERTSGLSFPQVALKNRQLVFIANPHLRLAAFAFEAADRSQPGSLSHRRI